MGIDLNFGQDEPGSGNNYELLEDGIYNLRLESMEYKEGKNAPYFNMKWSVGPDYKRFVWSIASLSEKPYPREQLQSLLETLTGSHWRGNQTLEPNELIGLMVNGVVITESYYSEKKNKEVEKNVIDAFLPVEDLEGAELEPF